jgi:hypothetical protein
MILYAVDKNKKPLNHTIQRLLKRIHSLYVGVARFELATSWSQTRRDDRTTLHPELQKQQHKTNNVIPKRFERLTYCLEGSCSIQLSYGISIFNQNLQQGSQLNEKSFK